jgi:hypothetical protein
MRRWAVLLLMVAASILSWAQTPDCASLTEQAFEMSGMNRELDQATQRFASDDFWRQFNTGSQDGGKVAGIVQSALRKNFDGPSLKKDLLHRVLTRCSTEQMSQAIQEMQTPFVARMMHLEAAAYTPEGQERIQKYLRVMQIAPPPDWQLETADAFDQKAGMTSFSVDAIVAVQRGMMTGLGAPPEAIAELKDQRKLLKVQIENTVLASIILTYNGVSKSDLSKYGDELSSGPLKWYHDTVRKSFMEILAEHATTMGQEIKDAVLTSRASGQ